MVLHMDYICLPWDNPRTDSSLQKITENLLEIYPSVSVPDTEKSSIGGFPYSPFLDRLVPRPLLDFF